MSDIKLLEQIGKRIYYKRKALKLTQEQLAEKVGVSTQMISNLECGKKAIRPENLVKVCEALGVSADYILTGNNAIGDVDEIVGKLSLLSGEELKMVKNIIDYMSGK